MEEKIRQDLRKAMLAKNELRVSTLRMLVSEITNLSIAQSGKLSDADIISLVQREVKKRREAAAGFRSGGREEAAQKEEVEGLILEEYLPEQLSDRELEGLVDETIAAAGASQMSDMGKVMGLLKEKVGAGADPSRTSSLVKSKLS